MLRTLLTLQRIKGSSGANRFMYYFMRIPAVGKLLNEHMYARAGLKRNLVIFVSILKLIWGFLSRFAYLGIVIFWPIKLAAGDLPLDEQYSLFLHIFVSLSFIVAAASNVFILEPKRDKYIAVKLMRIPAADYMHAVLVLKVFSFTVYSIPALLLFVSLLGAPLWHGLVLTLLLSAWRTVTEALNLLVFTRKNRVLVKNNVWVWSVIGAGYLLAFGMLYYKQPLFTSSILLSVPVMSGIVLLGLVAGIYIARYPDYRSAVNAVTKIDDPLLDMGRMMREARVAEVSTKETDYSGESPGVDRYKGKQGYAYLNAIFFSRHKRLLVAPIQRRLTLIGALLAAGLVTRWISPDTFSALGAYLAGTLSAFVLVMFYASIGERVCKAMFYNCDLSLLRYGFYREKNSILSNFRIRLIRLSLLNLIPALAICMSVSLLILLSGHVWLLADVVLYWVTILSLSLFVSVHHLSMYYIFQPYSTELNVKNPFFTIVNSIVVALCIICLRFQSDSTVFAFYVLLATMAYIVGALLLVNKFSVRTFRVK
ncbi:hypothetical protein [Paenibacillus donghaensis]|uniref:Uncharacterized protein n=1 Tax=Paenibacillus donghaensis TaxID=414771 RepID=A0A2Z2KGN2_9BACL|nr:hypothetical protein [Paenibacillus donghaensis]ASA19982.1 hypothetical protein B9T62_03690 [Paenibacillus donghaensis]